MKLTEKRFSSFILMIIIRSRRWKTTCSLSMIWIFFPITSLWAIRSFGNVFIYIVMIIISCIIDIDDESFLFCFLFKCSFHINRRGLGQFRRWFLFCRFLGICLSDGFWRRSSIKDHNEIAVEYTLWSPVDVDCLMQTLAAEWVLQDYIISIDRTVYW